MSINTPILFILFNRPDTTKIVFDRIKEIKPKKLFISIDGPRKNNEKDKQKVSEVIEIVKNIDWDCDVKYNISKKNQGCKLGVSNAINWFFKNVDHGIILEDDCLPDLSFFKYSETLLKKYKEDKEVFIISGFNPMQEVNNEESYFFSKYALIWGWATWQDRWEKYDIQLNNWPENKSEILDQFQLKKQKMTLEQNFNKVKMNKIDTWDIQFFYSMLEQKAYAIIPQRSLIENIGFSLEATHTFIKHDVAFVKHESINFPLKHPKTKELNYDLQIYKAYNPTLFKKIKSAINTIKSYLF